MLSTRDGYEMSVAEQLLDMIELLPWIGGEFFNVVPWALRKMFCSPVARICKRETFGPRVVDVG